MGSSPGETVSFVARFWLEPGSEGEHVWRGHSQHVQSGREIYFHDLTQLREFLKAISGVPFPCACTQEPTQERETGGPAR